MWYNDAKLYDACFKTLKDNSMVTITLQPDIAEQISDLASTNQISADHFVDKALRAYMAQYRREKIRAETETFKRQQEILLVTYADQYVAMYNGQVIDHDADLRTLHLRVFERLGRTPVLLKKVTREPERELVFRSPRFERNR